MALVRTTLSSAVAVADNSIVVASATGFSAGYLILIDQELMEVSQGYVSGTTIPVQRGQDGTKTSAHVVTASVVCGAASEADWSSPLAGTVTSFPTVRGTEIRSITATQSIDLPNPGNDLRLILNGTSVIAVTIPVPTKAMDGSELSIIANGAAAHTLTFTGGLSGAGSSYDVITMNGTGPVSLKFVAVNEKWQEYVATPMAGTVTNITASLA